MITLTLAQTCLGPIARLHILWRRDILNKITLYDSIKHKLESILQDEDFISRKELQKICSAENISQELRSHDTPPSPYRAVDPNIAGELAASSPKLFALLARHGKQDHAASLVQKHGVTDEFFDKPGDEKLRLLPTLDNADQNIMVQVLADQWQIPPLLKFGDHRSYLSNFIKPFTICAGGDPPAYGSFGVIHKATVAAGHLSLPNGIDSPVSHLLTPLAS